MTGLGILWFVLITILFIGYFVLDGFDLGVGVLYPFLGKNESEKKVMLRAIGPVWDGNEVWLLTAGGALFAAFAPAYATSFSGFYLAIMLVLFGLILRAVSVEFRAHETDCLRLWDTLFFVGSLLPALLFGVAIGNIMQGLPLNAHGDYVGGFFALLNPFALLCGVLTLAYTVFQGACWTALKAPAASDLRARATALRDKLRIVVLVVFALISALFFIMVLPAAGYAIGNELMAGIGAVGFVLSVLLTCLCGAESPKKDLRAFLLVSLGAACLVILTFSTLFPYLIPAQNLALSLTVANCAATDATLLPMTIIAVIGVPIMLVYQVIAYASFRGRVE